MAETGTSWLKFLPEKFEMCSPCDDNYLKNLLYLEALFFSFNLILLKLHRPGWFPAKTWQVRETILYGKKLAIKLETLKRTYIFPSCIKLYL